MKIVSQSSRTEDMTEGSPIRHILMFAIPLFIGMVFQQLYNVVDTMIAGYNLGESAIASIGATRAIYSLLMNFANGLNNGYGIVLSQLFGAKDRERFRKAAGTMVILDIVITLLLTVVALLILRPAMGWLQTPDEIMEQAYSYIAIILGGMITTILYNMCSGFLRAIGNSRIPLYFLILSCGINVVLDALFIIVLHMGVGGAAAATVIAQGASGLCCGVYIFRNYREFLPEKGEYRIDKEVCPEMLQTGVSMGMMLSVFSIGSIVLQRSINGLGTLFITAHTASHRVYEILMMPLTTLATANATFVGQNFGAKKMERIYQVMKQVILMELAWSIFSFVLSLGLGRTLISLLTGTRNPEILSYAMMNLLVNTGLFCPLGVLFVLRMAMQSMGHKIIPILSSTIELAMKVLSCIFLIPRKGYYGVMVTEPMTWVACGLFLTVVYFVSKNRQVDLPGGSTEKILTERGE